MVMALSGFILDFLPVFLQAYVVSSWAGLLWSLSESACEIFHHNSRHSDGYGGRDDANRCVH
jgi:hypothetical protein